MHSCEGEARLGPLGTCTSNVIWTDVTHIDPLPAAKAFVDVKEKPEEIHKLKRIKWTETSHRQRITGKELA